MSCMDSGLHILWSALILTLITVWQSQLLLSASVFPPIRWGKWNYCLRRIILCTTFYNQGKKCNFPYNSKNPYTWCMQCPRLQEGCLTALGIRPKSVVGHLLMGPGLQEGADWAEGPPPPHARILCTGPLIIYKCYLPLPE
uniref:Uncharacterized protein n=1 Tax=Pipistrellus kuhlii TaxID=59472 RepID=A0A7J7XV05_PIPKU|nr:hypothetical protein mPipKuh1_010435 [Pipistrellus kuhlii]